MLTIAPVAYPLAVVDRDPVGGAEQMFERLRPAPGRWSHEGPLHDELRGWATFAQIRAEVGC